MLEKVLDHHLPSNACTERHKKDISNCRLATVNAVVHPLRGLATEPAEMVVLGAQKLAMVLLVCPALQHRILNPDSISHDDRLKAKSTIGQRIQNSFRQRMASWK